MPVCVLLPAALLVAAPVRPAPPAEWKAGGLVTRADLDRVRFGPPGPAREGYTEDLPADHPNRTHGPARHARIAVHLPRDRFAHGEPVPAHFVLKNTSAGPLGLDARLDLFTRPPAVWNSAGIGVYDRAAGKPVPVIGLGGWMCFGNSMAVVPGDGYYVVRGDLGRTADGKPVPPGEYEVEWEFWKTRSAPARFTIAALDREPSPVPKPKAIRFARLVPGRAEADGGSVVAAGGATEVATALAVGHAGVYVPDIRAIPASDGVARAEAAWAFGADGDRLTVTVRAADPGGRLVLGGPPYLYVQIEDDGPQRNGGQALGLKQGELRRVPTPYTAEVRLPKGWRSGTRGAARVAVIVTSEPIDPGRGLAALLGEERVVRATAPGPDGPPVWRGLVRTAYADLPAGE